LPRWRLGADPRVQIETLRQPASELDAQVINNLRASALAAGLPINGRPRIQVRRIVRTPISDGSGAARFDT
jgi:hypothetical protein